jgi:hypothetical protein
MEVCNYQWPNVLFEFFEFGESGGFGMTTN